MHQCPDRGKSVELRAHIRAVYAGHFLQRPLSQHKTVQSQKCAGDIYKDHPFIRLHDEVALANIVGSNFCDLHYQKTSDHNYIVQGALDNLVKGAAGCAVQNMNLMCGYDETAGLLQLSPLYP